MFDNLFKTKYRLKLMKKLVEGIDKDGEAHTVYDEVKTLKINPAKTETQYKGKPYTYNLTEISYRKGSKAFIFKDIDNGQTVMKLGSDDWECNTDGELQKGKERLVRKAFSNNGAELTVLWMILLLIGGIVIGAILTNLDKLAGMIQ